MTNTGTVEGEINANGVHESEHLTDENKATAQNGGDAEQKPTKKEEQSRKEYVQQKKNE